MAGLGVIGRFFGNAAGETAAFAAGAAITPTLRPVLQQLANETWAQYPVRPPDALTLAMGVAQGQVPKKDAYAWGAENGYGSKQMDALVNIANVGPPLGSALQAFRRGTLDPGQYKTALLRAGIETAWFDALLDLKNERLSPEVMANAVQQGHVPNDGILPPIVTDGPPFDVPLTEIAVDPLDEAAASGVSKERLQVLANLAGLPPAAGEIREMLNRGYITPEAAVAGIREGHTKTKWTGPTLALRAAVLSATEAASARLRNWISKEEADAIGAMHGYTPEQMELLFLNRGRPATPRQLWIGWARKLKGPRGVPVTYEDHAKAIAISDIRPEYAELLWEARYNYPPLFQLNRLVASGSITADQAALWASYNLEAPEVIDALRRTWEHGASGQAKEATAANLRAEYEGLFIDRSTLLKGLTDLGYSTHDAEQLADLGDAARVKKYRDAVLTAVYKAYTGHDIHADQARATMTADGISPDAQADLLRIWDLELTIARKQLTAAQIAAGYKRQTISQAVALQELEDRGYSPADSAALLGLAAPLLTVAQIQAAYKSGEISRDAAIGQLTGQGYSNAQAVELVDTAVPPTTGTPPPAV